MNKPNTLKGLERTELLNRLHKKYANTSSLRQRFIYWRKKYSWIILIEGALFLKKMIDVVLASVLLVLFSPLLLLIVLLIKLNDGGPIFYISTRVGKWGREFLFPKFRSMQLNADSVKEQLKEFNEHRSDITFKMKQDPRVTWIGRILRKFSLDKLPQLWCVIKG